MGSLLFDLFPQALKEQTKYPKKNKGIVPTEHWSAGDLFFGVLDSFWRHKTQGVFPASKREYVSTHPLFVVSSSNYALNMCPCSSLPQYDYPRWSIPEGSKLHNTNEKIKRTTYVLKMLARPLMQEEEVSPAFYWGMFAPEELVEETK